MDVQVPDARNEAPSKSVEKLGVLHMWLWAIRGRCAQHSADWAVSIQSSDGRRGGGGGVIPAVACA